MQMWKPGVVALLAIVTSACANPNAPTYVQPIADCQYYGTGTLVLVNLGETLNPRDAYVDGRLVGVVAYGQQLALTVDAGVVHIVEWVTTFGGASATRVNPEPVSSS